jgi:hypothetical protein
VIATAHAVTPSDTREPPRGSLHPANLASREHSAQVMNLALQLADLEVRPVIPAYADGEFIDGVAWFNLTHGGAADHKESVNLAVRYIGLRSPDAFPWRFVRHPERPELARFEDLA